MEIREPEHIKALRYWGHDELQVAIDKYPESFTPTFVHVCRYFQHRVNEEI